MKWVAACIVVAGAAGCALPGDELARIRIEPSSIDLDVSLERDPDPIEVHAFAERFDGVDYEVSGDWSIQGPELGQFFSISGGINFYPRKDRGGEARLQITTTEGVGSVPIAITVHGLHDLNFIGREQIEIFDSLPVVDVQSSIAPGDDTIVPLDVTSIPITWDAQTVGDHAIYIRGPHLDLRTYGATFGELTEFFLSTDFAGAIRNTVPGGEIEIEMRSRLQQGPGADAGVRRSITHVKIADRPFTGSMMFSQEFLDGNHHPSFGQLLATSFEIQGINSFGFDFVSCLDCRLVADHANGRVAYFAPHTFPSRISDIATQTLLLDAVVPWDGVAFASATRMVVDLEGHFTLRDTTADFEHVVPIELGELAHDPAVSADGKQLAWVADDGALRIARFDVATAAIANPRTLVPAGPIAATTPDFSPDGRYLVYSRAFGGDVAGFTIIRLADDSRFDASLDARDGDARWMRTPEPIRAGGAIVNVGWIGFVTKRGAVFDDTGGVWAMPVDVDASHAYAPYSLFGTNFNGGSNARHLLHAPAFDARATRPFFGGIPD